MRNGSGHGGLAALCFAIAGVGACRDDVDVFEARDRDPVQESTRIRLTFNPGSDRSPTWSAGGDTIYYSAEGAEAQPLSPGVLVALSVDGIGARRTLLSNVQLPNLTARWLTTPLLAPDGERLAFSEVLVRSSREACEATTPVCNPSVTGDVLLPSLFQVTVSVRRLDATHPLREDPRIDVSFPGITTEVRSGQPLLYRVQIHPFYRLFEDERSLVFRPSWAPDGERLVFSDGLGLWIWTVGDETAVEVPGTTDGVWPAWSPNGDWIVFTRVERADSSGTFCVHVGGFGPTCEQERMEYVPGRRTLLRVRPDGMGLGELGEGEQAAWAPDGSVLFFRREDSIWRSAADGSGAVRVPGTNGGREPAVSADGRRLAFSIQVPDGSYDIWVLRLE